MARYTEDTKKNTDLHQQMPVQNPTPEVDRQSGHSGNGRNKLHIENETKRKWRKPPETTTHHMEPLGEEAKR